MARQNPFTGDRTRVAALNVEIDHALKKRLDLEATQRRISKRSIVERALQAYFDPDQQDERDAMLARRLLNLDRRYEGIERQNKIMAEALAVFVQGWLVQNPEIPPEQRAPANAQASLRYAKFIERIARNFAEHSTLYDRLPQEVIVTAADFLKAAGAAPAAGGT